MASSEQVLITRIKHGEAAAWQRLIDEYEGRLLAFARHRLRDHQTAEDVVQETLIGFLTALPNYDPAMSLQSFLFSICAHKITDRLRSMGRRPSLLSLSEGDGNDSPSPQSPARRASSIARSREQHVAVENILKQCLSRLIVQWKLQGELERLKCIELLLVRGLPNQEVARQLLISEQAVANHKQFVVGKLREAAQAARMTQVDETRWGL